MRLNGIFKCDMVFQADREIRIFGNADKRNDSVISCLITDEAGTLICQGKTETVEDDGSFLIRLPGAEAGGPYKLEVSSGSERILLERIYIGEVWIAGGQSNMEYPLVRSDHAKETIEKLSETKIHFYKVPAFGNLNDEQEEAEASSAWEVVDKNTCKDMSAVAFYFARKVLDALSEDGRKELHIGIIGCYLGGTSISSWVSRDTLMRLTEGRRYIDEFNVLTDGISEEEYEARKTEYDLKCEAYNRRLEELLEKDPYITYIQAEKQLGPGAWPPPYGPACDRRPAALFEAMVLRIAPFASRGVIFYQGETDTENHEDDYAVMFTNLIGEWRDVFLDSNLPFVFCQLPMYSLSDPVLSAEVEEKWDKLRLQQQIVADTVPYTWQVSLIDCGEVDNIHPSEKQTPGERLADAALRYVYMTSASS